MENRQVFLVERSAGCAGRCCGDLFRSAGSDNLSAVGSAARAHVNDVIGMADDVKVMFNDDDGGAVFDEGLKNTEQVLDIKRVEADGRFIKYKNRIRLGFAHFAGTFEALGFAAGKSGRFFAESELAEAQFL